MRLIRWEYGIVVVIISFVIFFALRCDLYPVHLDSYYHLSMARAFEKAGGVVVKDFWQYAPYGRPNLYPPFTHLLLLVLVKLNFKLITALKLVSFFVFPALLVTLAFVIRYFFSSKTLVRSSTYTG